MTDGYFVSIGKHFYLILERKNAMICPACHAEVIHRLGKTVKGRQSFVCFTCGKEFVPQSVSAAAQRQ